jgi:hypothetical protein
MLEELVKKITSGITDIKEIGFKNGKMSILLFLYHYSRINPEAKDLADTVLKDVFSEFKTSFRNNYTFANGSSGIIWTVEYLKENHFIDAETDALFNTMDNSMRSLTSTYPVLLDSNDYPFSPGLYFLKRFRNNKSILDYNIQIALIYLTDHAEKMLEFESYKKIGIERLSGEEMNFLLFFLLQMDKLNVFPYKVKKLLSAMEGYIERASYTNILDILVLQELLPGRSTPSSGEVAYPIEELVYKASCQSLFFNSPDIFNLLMSKLELTKEVVSLLFENKYESLSLAQWAIIGLFLID